MRFFVTGTDTGVGKTEVSAGLLAAMVRRGARPFAFKPAESGGTGDAEALQAAAGGWQPLDQVCLYRLAQPLAPGIAAREEGVRIDWARVLRHFRSLGRGPGVVEGAGGLFVPFSGAREVVDLIVALKLPVVLVARAGLGTLNHTSLSLEALARRAVKVAAVVLVQGTRAVDASVKFNRAELERRFPSVRFLGPVPFTAKARARRKVFADEVSALLEEG